MTCQPAGASIGRGSTPIKFKFIGKQTSEDIHPPHAMMRATAMTTRSRSRASPALSPAAAPARPSRATVCARALGDKVLPMIRGPADLLFMGPRVALGALLSAGQNLEQL